MAKKVSRQPTLKEIEGLLGRQTVVILNAVDQKLNKTEISVNKKISKLTTSIDKFLKKTTDLDDEIALMKADLKRVKAVLKEKLGVALD
ncbi:hypothetical protein AMJ47_02000 [Parcubacteria bacterium DG_72]|nr:MAG: hypothetical protein AMJ47_02000 [Parcubacteria bacterium DG_72]